MEQDYCCLSLIGNGRSVECSREALPRFLLFVLSARSQWSAQHAMARQWKCA